MTNREIIKRAMSLLGQRTSKAKSDAALRNINARWAAVRAEREAMRQAVAMADKNRRAK
jgi:hypothetical protein